jgi:hypothetical protein
MEWVPPAAAVTIGLMVRWIVVRHPEFQADWPEKPLLQWNGADQLWVFGPATRYVEIAVVVFVLAATLMDLFPWKKDGKSWKERRIFLEFYLVAICLTSLLPENLRPRPEEGWIGMLVSRLTLISAIFALGWLGTLRPRVWHLAALGACAAVFFAFTYQGERGANHAGIAVWDASTGHDPGAGRFSHRDAACGGSRMRGALFCGLEL